MSYYDKLFASVGVDMTTKNAMLTQKAPVKNTSTFQTFKKHMVYQADLVYMPEDQGYKYLLVIVDIASKEMDAEPLQDRRGEDVVNGMESILQRKLIKKEDMYYLYTDPGSEFKNQVFANWCERLGVIHRTTKTARKDQMAVVESMNYKLTKVLGVRMTIQQLEESDIKWVDKVRNLVGAVNEHTDHSGKKIETFFKDPQIKKNEKIYKEGDLVHVPLDQPKGATDGKRMHGKFRNGDLRYEKEPRKIERVLIHPNQPVRYLVEGIKNASYLGADLLPITAYRN